MFIFLHFYQTRFFSVFFSFMETVLGAIDYRARGWKKEKFPTFRRNKHACFTLLCDNPMADSQVRVHHPTSARIIENFHLVWLDRNIDDYCNSIPTFPQIINTTNIFTDPDECIDFITGEEHLPGEKRPILLHFPHQRLQKKSMMNLDSQ